VSRKRDKAELPEALLDERPRLEIDLIAERVREKLAEEQRIRDIENLLSERERLQAMVSWWRSFAITLMLALGSTVLAVLLYFCGLIVQVK
jgi:transposase